MPVGAIQRLLCLSLLLAAFPVDAAEMDWRPAPMLGQPQFYYLPSGSLLDVYVMPPALNRLSPYAPDTVEQMDEGRYDWRTGLNFRMQNNIAMSVETRRQGASGLNLSEEGDTSWKMQMKPTELRVGFNYRW